MQNFYIKRTDDAKDLELPKIMTIGSAGMDLYANVTEPTIIKKGQRGLVPTGIMIDIPVGFEAQVRPRSGLAFKFGITVLNTPGTIDSDYRGEIKAILINHGDEDFVINRGDRIAQMVINKVEMIEFEEVETLSETVRGEGGFGHSGVSSDKITTDEPVKAEIEVNDEIFNDINNFKDELSISKVIKFFEMKNIAFTKTMIQNYNRVGALPQLHKNRFYTRNHLVYLYYIDLLKSDFTLKEIKDILDNLNSENDMLFVHSNILRLQKQLEESRKQYINSIRNIATSIHEEKVLLMLEANKIKKLK